MVNQGNKDSNVNAKDVTVGATSLAGLGTSKNLILGKKRMYHGTSLNNWNKIKEEGLKSHRGGTGGASEAINSAKFMKASKDTVHLTRFKPVANMYSNDVKNHKPINLFRKGKEGKVLKINMDYDKFKKMRIDNAGGDDITDIPKHLRGVAKNVAAKGKIDVTPEEIVGASSSLKKRFNHTIKNLPGYAKNNPIRFGGGLALAGLSSVVLANSINNSRKEKTAHNYYLEIEKTALNNMK